MKKNIRNVKINKREGSVIYLKSFLKESHIHIGQWLVIKATNLIDNKEITFPVNIRSNYKINIRKAVRYKLGLTFDRKVPIKFEIVNTLKNINLENKDINGLSQKVIEILPSTIRINNTKIKLNCFAWKDNKVIFSYQNSKSSNYIIMNKIFTFDPFIVGIWRADGGKHSLTRSALQFTNSNSGIIQRWMVFLCSLGFSKEDPRISYYIQYISPKKDLNREHSLLRFWSEKLDIPKDYFGFIYKEGPGNNSKNFGSLQIKFNNSTLSFIIQYLFLKFEKSLLLHKWDKFAAVDYIKGTLCDCNCQLRKNRLHGITFSTSSKEEGTFIQSILWKYFRIFSRGQQDPRNKCYYIRITHYDNYLKFAQFGIFMSLSWMGDNSNYHNFVKGFSVHKGSLDMLKKKDKRKRKLVSSVYSKYLQSMLKGNGAVPRLARQSSRPELQVEV